MLCPFKTASISSTLKLFGEESDGEILKSFCPWLVTVLLVKSVKKKYKLIPGGLNVLSGRQYVYMGGFIGFSGRWAKINKGRKFFSLGKCPGKSSKVLF